MAVHDPRRCPIAVVGVSAIFPGSVDATGFWNDIVGGRDLISDIPKSHWLIDDYYDPDPAAPDKTYAHRGAFLPDVDFDPLEWGVPPSIVPATDTTQLLALIVAKKVLEDACQGDTTHVDRDRISCILGITSAQELLGTMVNRLQRPVWVKALREMGYAEEEVQLACDRISDEYVPWQESTFPGLLGNVVAGRIANRLDLGGTNCVTDAACASSFSAISMAVNELWLGQSDLVLSGGADTMNDIFMYMCFSKTPALSKSGECRPFSDKADGTLLGEGLGMVALKRLADAERDGDRIYAVLKGIGSSSDGRSKSVYAPVSTGQAKALRRAYDQAGYGPETVEIVEAHGTGTKAGDAAEFEGLRLAFSESDRADPQWCALGTVKSQIGHTKAAAGAAGLFKIVMALHHKVLPPTIKIDRPNPKLEIETSPFYLNTQARPWIRGGDHPRRGSVSSFGFGGSNFHLTLEEYEGPAPRAFRSRTAPTELVVLGAATPIALASSARALAERSDHPDFLVYAAQTSQAAFDASAPARLAVIANDAADLQSKLGRLADRIDAQPDEPFAVPTGMYYSHGVVAGQVAFLFPGQGSQYLGMAGEVAMALDVARAPLDAAADLPLGPVPLHRVMFPPPVFDEVAKDKLDAQLRSTEWAQPAIGAASLALLEVMNAVGLVPDMVGGHSYGEITALCAAGTLTPTDCLRVARKRGELMAEAARTDGAMIAVPLGVDDVRPYVDAVEGVVLANHNAPMQVVVSGPTEAVEAVRTALLADGVEPKVLKVATAFHSPVVSDSVAPFRQFLDGIEVQTPRIPVYHNPEAAPYPSDPDAIRSCLGGAVARPVRFVEQIEAMVRDGARTFVEIGPGHVLSNLVQEICADATIIAVPTDRRRKHGMTALHHALGRLAVAGHGLDLAALWAGYAPAADPHDRTKPRLSLSINGANYDKPYPPPGGTAALPPPNAQRVGEARARNPAPEVIEKVVHVPVATPGQPATAPTQAGGSVSQPPSDPWILAFQEAQRATVDAHTAYQQAMANSHEQFLRTVEASMSGLQGLLTGQPVPATAPSVAWTPPAAEAPVLSFAPPNAPADDTALVQSGAEVVGVPAPPAPAPAAPAPGVDLEALLLAVVADKTGYPADMLEMGMALESDLGIDSIKRVEILSAVRDAAPGLPEVDTAEMAKLNTLGQVVEHLAAALPPGATTAPSAAAPTTAAPAIDLHALLLSVVADKTGYPADMLEMGMALESDLGIDSIKRVEILSAVRDAAPGLPEVDTAEMAKLNTLGQVVEHLAAALPPEATAAPSAVAPAAAAASPSVDLEALLLSVVADKTGYPADMLEMGMALESDLGIDSIKRVEILSAVRDAAPGLPEVDTAEMAKLNTLGQVVEHLRGAVPAAAADPVTPPSASPDRLPLGRWRLEAYEAAAVGMSLPGLSPTARIAVVPTGPEADAVVAALARRHLTATAVAAPAADADVVLFVEGLGDVADVAGAAGIHRQAFLAAKAVADRFGTTGGLFVTVQDTGGDFGLSGSDRAWTGGLPGLVKTVDQEWPAAHCKAIDVQRGDAALSDVADAIVSELLAGGPELEVGLGADGRRWALRSVPADVAATRPALDAASVVVASGGGRGVTAHTLIALAARYGGHYALLGRTALSDDPPPAVGIDDEAGLKGALLKAARAAGETPTPADLGRSVSRILANRQIRDTIAQITSAGGSARYFAVDVTDADAVAATFTEVRDAWGPITAVVHGAGVLADKLVADKTVEQFDRVFDTKVRGLSALLAATAADPLSAILLFSSVAGRCGNRGQSDYAMANEVLAKVAAHEARNRPDCIVKALQWGPWEGGMVTPELEAHFAAQGVAVIDLDAGARMLVDEAADRSGHVEVVLGGEPRMGPLASAGGATDLVLRIRADRTAHPYLADHQVAGTPVVPVVMVLEWFARAAAAFRPDLSLQSVREIKVLRGIRLDGFDTGGNWFDITVREISNGTGAVLGLDLKSADGVPHYSALVDVVPQRSPAPDSPTMPQFPPVQAGAIYDGTVLFHGRDFQVIQSLQGASDDGLTATVVGTADIGWADEGWRTDPAALDGGLQMALLFSARVLGGAALPMGLSSMRTFQDGPPTGPLTAILTGEKRGRDRTVTDIVFTDSGGTVVHELLGVQAILRPDA